MTGTISITKAPDGVNYACLAGKLLGLALILMALFALLGRPEGFFASFKAGYFILYGSLLNLPYKRLPPLQWKWAYGLLVFASMAFVFVMIVSVIFDYMAADDRGERLGVPGFEGTLIFLALLQVPAVLFQHRPDLLD